MKKILLSLAAVCISFAALADEGMWMLPYLQKMNIKNMRAMGCKLSAEDIYSANHASLKDAIVVFGGGCTGEIVSPDGLVFTNYHCGYGSIQALSSVEHDYLKNGFWAQSRAEEIPAPGLTVRFVRSISDVTAQVLGNVPSIAEEAEFEKITSANISTLNELLAKENPGMTIVIKPFFGGNQYFAFVMEVYNDVRLVGTPPTSIGKFGGETDNWMWPRHTGDFSVFRVYAGADNRPAAYSSQNKPYKAEKYLKVSVDGYKEGDFAMIMGFPGSTQRYMTSYEIDNLLNIENPNRIFVRGERQAILKKDMAENDTVRIQYASKYASSSNYWKNSIGKSRGILKLKVKDRKQAQEEAFQRWAEKNTLPEEGYIDALPKIKLACEALAPIKDNSQYISEAFLRSIELLTPAQMVQNGMKAKDEKALKIKIADWYKDYNASTDRKVTKLMLRLAREHMTDLPTFYTEIVDKDFGGDTDAYADYLFDHSAFASLAGADEMIDNYTAEKFKTDPIVPMLKSILAKLTELNQAAEPLEKEFNEGCRKYIAGLMLQTPQKAWASDANFTIRLTYGRILPYEPADGVEFNFYTTLKGVIEKENPDNPVEFTVPDKIKKLYADKDYGRYANTRGELPVAFLVDCDITGGNSGSPVMNAKGELIGLAFDGNWEAMSGDVAFEPDLQRTIAVDVRYVLFVIDKFAGAKWIVDELSID